MSNTFSWTFDEIPLVIDANGVEAGLVSGEAEIEYSSDGEWSIENITLQGFGARLTPTASVPGTQVECPLVIAAIIDNRLNKEWYTRRLQQMPSAISSSRTASTLANSEADYRRDDRRMGF